MAVAVGVALLAASFNYKSPVETINLPLAPRSAQHVVLHCVEPKERTGKGVLFVHGASFPTMLAAGFEFDGGDSWIDFMAGHGFLACGLDFLGYGASSRPPGMLDSPAGKPPLVRAPEAAREIAIAIRYMRTGRGIDEMHLIAHSWGTIPAAEFAAQQPSALTSLTLFGPVVPQAGSKPESEHAAWWSITGKERLQQLYFKDVLPPGLVLLEPALGQRWAGEFEASTPHIAGDAPGAIRIPDGAVADIEAAHAGVYPYQASRVRAPLFIVFGSYDTEVNVQEAPAFLARFTSSPLKWQLCIRDGSHVMHLERNRTSLYESVLGFIHTTEKPQS